jgi:uncharacterized membrane protein (DUF485 family)
MAGASYNWSEVAKHPKYIELRNRKRNFLFGWWIASTIYYFLLPIVSGYAPDLFNMKIVGAINFGYFFILSQFVVAFFVAIYYTRVASDFDRLNEELVQAIQPGGKSC